MKSSLLNVQLEDKKFRQRGERVCQIYVTFHRIISEIKCLFSDATKRPPAVEMVGRELVFGLISPPQNCTNLIRESSQVPAVKELLVGL